MNSPGCHQTEQARMAVTNTPELLESILLQLDIRTLLTSAQLVCRSWQNLIHKSPSIQQILFLLPAEGKANVVNDSDEKVYQEFNPLLASCFPAWFSPSRSKEDLIVNMPWVEKRTEEFLRPEASWRHMLVCQPPSYHLRTVYHASIQWSTRTTVRVNPRKEGVRMADLFDPCFNYAFPTFQVYWASERKKMCDERQSLYPSIWNLVERARNEAEMIIFLSSSEGCCSGEDDEPPFYNAILNFVKQSKITCTPEDESGWVEIVEGTTLFD